MADRSQIEKNIEKTRKDLIHNIDEINSLVRGYLDVKKQMRQKPGNIILAATFIGFVAAVLTTKTGRSFLSKTFKPAFAVGSAYFSQKILHNFRRKVFR